MGGGGAAGVAPARVEGARDPGARPHHSDMKRLYRAPYRARFGPAGRHLYRARCDARFGPVGKPLAWIGPRLRPDANRPRLRHLPAPAFPRSEPSAPAGPRCRTTEALHSTPWPSPPAP